MKIEVYIATHKAYDFPQLEEYIPIHVGKAKSTLDLKILGDDTEDNISNLNPHFCELTALYWMWKNSQADILGLVHYRRYFEGRAYFSNKYSILSREDIKHEFSKGINVILAKKEKFIKSKKKIMGFKFEKYFKIGEQYIKSHYQKDWELLGQTICEKYPDYMQSFNEVSLSGIELSPYNMFIADNIFVENYCSWLFDILFDIRNKMNLLCTRQK